MSYKSSHVGAWLRRRRPLQVVLPFNQASCEESGGSAASLDWSGFHDDEKFLS